jgi:hypothetical protein
MWTGSDWQLRGLFSGALQPGGVVSDAESGRVLMFGNAVQAAQGLPQPVHVWEWEGSAWYETGPWAVSEPEPPELASVHLPEPVCGARARVVSW